jgi:preprotein translocase subunit SecA
LNKQREIIYAKRANILKSKDEIKNEVKEKIYNAIETIVNLNAQNFSNESPSKQIIEEFATIIPFDENSLKQLESQIENIKNIDEKIEFLKKVADDVYAQKEKLTGEDLTRQIEKFVCLSVIDNLWVDHLDIMENLRQGIGLRGYGQKDPLVEYKNEAFKMFEQLINRIDDEIVHRIYKIQAQNNPVVENLLNNPRVTDTAAGSNIISEVSAFEKTHSKKKLGRNDPCWCGSGKKYKKCHWPN